MDQAKIFDAIFTENSPHFEAIFPLYRKFLVESQAHQKSQQYFLDRNLLVNDFYRWLQQTGHINELTQIDRRSGIDRRGDFRPENPGRRQADRDKAQSFFQKLGEAE